MLRPILFQADAEAVHHAVIRVAELAGASRLMCALLAAGNPAADERLGIDIAGLHFDSPIGLAAGFDKSARAVRCLPALGFGHVEVGSISAEPSAGNPKPRLFLLPDDHGIVVNDGLPNDGAERVAQRLSGWRRKVPLGLNVACTNRGPGAPQETDDAVIDDYVASVRMLQPHADYLCLNLGCPDRIDGRNFFHDRSRLERLLAALQGIGIIRPLFLKVAPFATLADIDSLLEAVDSSPFIVGFSVNLPSGQPGGMKTPTDRLAGMPGAVSGLPAARAADRTIAQLYHRMDRKRHQIIGSGGVFTAEDAYRKIRLGASLVQVFTAMVYEGPFVARDIIRGLPRLIRSDGLQSVGDAVGIDA